MAKDAMAKGWLFLGPCERCMFRFLCKNSKLVREGGLYHIEASSMICSAYQWAGFYIIGTCLMKELTDKSQ